MKATCPLPSPVVLSVPGLPGGFSLLLRSPTSDRSAYPTDRLQKGWLLARGERLLAGEGAGFALPLARYGYRTVFPASVRLAGMEGAVGTRVCAIYDLALVERLARRSERTPIASEAFYHIREGLSAVHRNAPLLRGSLDALSDSVFAMLNLETRFEPLDSVGTVEVTSELHPSRGRLEVNIDLSGLQRKGCTGVTVANEQGGWFFDSYRDSDGTTLAGEEISSWAETAAASASLVDRHNGVAFTLERVPGARLFRGREMRAGRLAWAGLDYVLPPGLRRFQYELGIEAI